MALLSSSKWVAVLLLICCVQWSHSLHVQFFAEQNFTGFIDEVILSSEEEKTCYTLEDWIVNILSIKSDKCIIYYFGPNCDTSEQGSNRIDDDNTRRYMRPIPVRSLHVCGQELGGGPQLDLDLYYKPPEDYVRELVKSYRGICDCQNVPSWVKLGKTKTLSVDQHGNSMQVFANENCQGDNMVLSADSNTDSLTYYFSLVVYLRFDVRSFRPNNLENCFRLVALITKFHFLNETNADGLLPQKVQLAGDSLFSNDGAAEITQTYRVSEKVSESVEYSIAESFTHTESTEVSAGVESTMEMEIPLIAKVSVTAKLESSYSWSSEMKSETGKKTTASAEREFTIEQTVRIPPCKVCRVSSYVQKVKGFPMKYLAFATISAAKDARQVSADVLKKNLPPGMTYVKTIDSYSVQAVTEGTLYADIGMKSGVDVKCDRELIEGCATFYNADDADDNQEYETYLYPFNDAMVGRQRSTAASTPSTFLSFLKNSFSLIGKHLA